MFFLGFTCSLLRIGFKNIFIKPLSAILKTLSNVDFDWWWVVISKNVYNLISLRLQWCGETINTIKMSKRARFCQNNIKLFIMMHHIPSWLLLQEYVLKYGKKLRVIFEAWEILVKIKIKIKLVDWYRPTILCGLEEKSFLHDLFIFNFQLEQKFGFVKSIHCFL